MRSLYNRRMAEEQDDELWTKPGDGRNPAFPGQTEVPPKQVSGRMGAAGDFNAIATDLVGRPMNGEPNFVH
jgi:hypothetical protein